ncbi:MAG: hypothetical protein LBE80_02405 [Deltaproteobacteria bacterium]|jgi:high-affinity Fe2+/Pb2+ permease|nr:hypothetical protein [Deltaproteobacteria bacterium]
MPPTYLIVMALYTVLTAYILYLVISNMLRSRDVWEQIMAVFVIVPLFMRLIFIK